MHEDVGQAFEPASSLERLLYDFQISLHELRSPQSMKIVRSDGFSRPWACD